jgi:hypothetical protein
MSDSLNQFVEGEPPDLGHDGSEDRPTCLSTQILWDRQNAKMFGDLCRRSLRLCEQGQPCPPISAEDRILLVSSQRGLTMSPQGAAAAAAVRQEVSLTLPTGRSDEALAW